MKRPNILLVDDDDWSLELMCMTLSQLTPAPHCFTAQTPAEALKICEDHDIDLVTTDWFRPESVEDFIKELKIRFPSVPFVVISGGGPPRWKEEAIQLGAAACLSKPFALEELKQFITELTQPQAT